MILYVIRKAIGVICAGTDTADVTSFKARDGVLNLSGDSSLPGALRTLKLIRPRKGQSHQFPKLF